MRKCYLPQFVYVSFSLLLSSHTIPPSLQKGLKLEISIWLKANFAEEKIRKRKILGSPPAHFPFSHSIYPPINIWFSMMVSFQKVRKSILNYVQPFLSFLLPLIPLSFILSLLRSREIFQENWRKENLPHHPSSRFLFISYFDLIHPIPTTSITVLVNLVSALLFRYFLYFSIAPY